MKNFLVTTPIKESYNVLKKNVFLGSWCFTKTPQDIKKNKVIHYHWSDRKKFKKDSFYIDKIAKKFCNILSKNLNRIHNLNEDYKYWELLIYPWTHHYVSSMYDRWEIINTFLKKNHKNKISTYQLKIDERNFAPKNHLGFIENTFNDTWNHLVFVRIIKFLKLKNVNIIKKNCKNLDINKGFEYQKEKKGFFYYLIFIYELLFSKLAFRYNKIILESFSFPTKEFLQILRQNLIFPALYKNLFEDIGNKKDWNFEKRKMIFSNLSKEKYKDKFFCFLIENLIYDFPISYLENFLKIRDRMMKLANKKKLIISMRSWNYNDQFKICVAELVKKNSEYFTCEHGGGLVGEYMNLNNYTGKIVNHIHYDIDNKYKRKSVRLSPTINVIDNKEFDTKKNKKLNITFLEGEKYSHKLVSSAKAQDGIKQISEVLSFIKLLPPEIKKNVYLRSKPPYMLNIKDRFIKKFGKEQFNDWDQSFSDFAKSSKLMLVNYPQTAFSSCMYFNVPTILICEKKFWFFKKKSLRMFNLLKKNNMAFENFNDARKFIVKNWDETHNWWSSNKIQKIRKLYLQNFFNIEKNWMNKWSNFIYKEKKKLFN